MSEEKFFQGITHEEVPWREYKLHVPLFYPDFLFMSASFMAPIENVEALIPSKRMKPYRITPWHSAVSITTYAYRDCDLGPYNEVSIGIPVTLDTPTPFFVGSLRRMPSSPMSYSHRLPVTTEIARVVGVEFAGYPKFIANIDFEEDGDFLTCILQEREQHILSLSGRILPVKRYPRYVANPITFRDGYILRSEFVISEREMGRSTNREDIRLELGDHQISQELKELRLGRLLGYNYCPAAQGILTPVFESFAG
jgi:hypothetical protein